MQPSRQEEDSLIWNRALLDAVRDAVFLADIATGMIVDANPAAEYLCGRSLAELQVMHHTELHPPENAELARQGFDENVRVPGLIEGLLLHKSGRRIPVEISSSQFATPDGKRIQIGVFPTVADTDFYPIGFAAETSGASI